MGATTEITWCDSTFNPWIGCQKISPACKHCYAEVSTPARTLRHGGLEVWGPPATTERKRTSRANWQKPLAWNRTAERSGKRIKVFCASLADVFEDHPSLTAWRLELFALIEKTPLLDWQLLTKRPENIRAMLPPSWLKSPRENVWLGTTVEDQASADKRIPELLSTPAAVRFLSCEPLLGPVNLFEWIGAMSMCSKCGEEHEGHIPGNCPDCGTDNLVTVWGEAQAERWRTGDRYDPQNPEGAADVCGDGSLIDWVIVGGESGHNARPFDLAWARSIVDQCKSAYVAVFVKQLGAHPVNGDSPCTCGHTLTEHWLPFPAPCRHGHRPPPTTPCEAVRLAMTPEPDGACPCMGFSPIDESHRVVLRDSHGGDMAEWPSDLCVREFPSAGGAR